MENGWAADAADALSSWLVCLNFRLKRSWSNAGEAKDAASFAMTWKSAVQSDPQLMLMMLA